MTFPTPNPASASARSRQDLVSFGAAASAQPRLWAMASTATLDNTASIQAALNSQTEIIIPEAPANGGRWRLDGSLTVQGGKVLTLEPKAALFRSPLYTANTDPLIRVRDYYTTVRGGIIRTENAHPDGIIKVGAQNDADASPHLWWELRDFRTEGLWAAGNIAVNINSNEWLLGVGAPVYFGKLLNLFLNQSDVALMVNEVCNANFIENLQVHRAITAAVEMRGAGQNQMSGGFLHSSTNGVVGVRLRQRTRGANHHSNGNVIMGFNVEPGGAASRGVTIEASCNSNTAILNASVGGGNSDLGENNVLATGYGSWLIGQPFHGKSTGRFDGDATFRGQRFEWRQETKTRAQQGGLAENVPVDLFSVALAAGQGIIAEVSVVSRNNTLGRWSKIKQTVGIHRPTSGDPVVGTAVGLNDNTNGGITFVASPGIVTVRHTPFNNGTATTSTVNASMSVMNDRADAMLPTDTRITVL